MITRILYTDLSLSGSRISLHPPDLLNWETTVIPLITDPRVMLWCGGPDSPEEYRRRVLESRQSSDAYIFWIKRDATFIGIAGIDSIRQLSDDGRYAANVYYIVAPLFQNKGVATAVLSRLEEFAFTEMRPAISVTEVRILMLNHASMRVAEKCGYREVARYSTDWTLGGTPIPLWHGFKPRP